MADNQIKAIHDQVYRETVLIMQLVIFALNTYNLSIYSAKDYK